uniref:Uncharacterized protein n=1 Tax=Rhizophora mucronata TaxID=61149 RepID=A0A2P2Q5G7_RHIMU
MAGLEYNNGNVMQTITTND